MTDGKCVWGTGAVFFTLEDTLSGKRVSRGPSRKRRSHSNLKIGGGKDTYSRTLVDGRIAYSSAALVFWHTEGRSKPVKHGVYHA